LHPGMVQKMQEGHRVSFLTGRQFLTDAVVEVFANFLLNGIRVLVHDGVEAALSDGHAEIGGDDGYKLPQRSVAELEENWARHCACAGKWMILFVKWVCVCSALQRR
jgi:hypothetical protein